MKTEYESAEAREGAFGSGEGNFERLFEKIRLQPSSDQPPAETPQPPFRPTSFDIDEFLKSEWTLGGLSHEKLQEISQRAQTEGNNRRQQLAQFLNNNFDDVKSLSNEGNNKLSRSDLELYGQLLRHNELSSHQNKPDPEGWKQLHFEHEMKQSLIPIAGGGAGAIAGQYALKWAAQLPAVETKMLALKAANPRAYFGALAVAAAGTYFGSYACGRRIGDAISSVANTGAVNRHFYDEAAPAFRRLIKD